MPDKWVNPSKSNYRQKVTIIDIITKQLEFNHAAGSSAVSWNS